MERGDAADDDCNPHCPAGAEVIVQPDDAQGHRDHGLERPESGGPSSRHAAETFELEERSGKRGQKPRSGDGESCR